MPPVNTLEELNTKLKKYDKLFESLANEDGTGLEQQVGQMRNQLKDIIAIVKSGYGKVLHSDTGWNDGMAKDFCDFMFAVRINDKEKIAEIQQKAGVIGSPLYSDSGSGAYCVPEGFIPEIMRCVEEESVMKGLITSYDIKTGTAKVPVQNAGAIWTWLTGGTAVTKTETNPTFSTISATIKTAALWIELHQNFLEDATEGGKIIMGNYFKTLIAESWAAEYDRCVLAAGIDEHSDQFDGLLNDSNVNELILDPGKPAFADVEADDLLNLAAELDSKAKRRGARYFLHATVMDKVRSLKNAMGDYIYQKPAEGKPGTIWGYPFTEVDGMPDLADSAASTPFIGFCNPKYLLNLNRIGMEVKMFSETIQAVTDDLSYLSARTRQFFAVAVPTACAKLTTNAS